jgi:hypothetical protein
LQDCFGGCTDPSQGFYGMMDEVRIWKTVRSQDDIIRHMRWASGLENNADLIAYWQFNDPDSDNGQFKWVALLLGATQGLCSVQRS